MNPVKWFTRNHVAGNFLMLVVLVAGFATWFTLKKEIFPEVSIDAVSVSIPYPNATPEETERGVVVPAVRSTSWKRRMHWSPKPPGMPSRRLVMRRPQPSFARRSLA